MQEEVTPCDPFSFVLHYRHCPGFLKYVHSNEKGKEYYLESRQENGLRQQFAETPGVEHDRDVP
jgi:hypothetical protein